MAPVVIKDADICTKVNFDTMPSNKAPIGQNRYSEVKELLPAWILSQAWIDILSIHSIKWGEIREA